MVLAPKYGESKKNLLPLSYRLVGAGFNVVRFDFTNHVGESEGLMERFTLSGAVEDVYAAIDYTAEQSDREVGIIANSLSNRMALRAVSNNPRVGMMFSVVGVVHIQDTLAKVYQEDVITRHIQGKTWGTNDVLGLPIQFENFLADTLRAGLHTMEGTVQDAEKVKAPITFFAAELDAWVNIEDVRAVAGRCAQAELVVIPRALHEIRENPEAARELEDRLMRGCCEWAFPGQRVEVPAVDKRTLIQQNKVERDRLRQISDFAQADDDFWSTYLEKYGFFGRVDVYQDYVRTLGEHLGEADRHAMILDAGAGNGLVGAWALKEWFPLVDDGPKPTYVAIELTSEGLRAAMKLHASMVPARPLWMTAYSRVNLDEWGDNEGAFDLANDTFTHVVSSLVLSYLENPFAVVEEFARVLRPGGVLVISSMKPHADLSKLYLDYAQKLRSEDELDSARSLLNAAGAIKLREDAGIYRFFSGEEMEEMIQATGLELVKTEIAFGDQAIVVSARKPVA